EGEGVTEREGARGGGIDGEGGGRVFGQPLSVSLSLSLRAVGCIFGELLNNSPLFPGENDIEQLCCVLRVLGTPNETIWPEITELPDYNKITFKENPPIPLRHIVPDAAPEAVDLLQRFLVYPSARRIRAAQVITNNINTNQ
uniref:cyclin-dependent kinase n=1 Tax=Callorhinchus milii TaxID=7868 RepID=A0A4W3GDE2_CALMI